MAEVAVSSTTSDRLICCCRRPAPSPVSVGRWSDSIDSMSRRARSRHRRRGCVGRRYMSTLSVISVVACPRMSRRATVGRIASTSCRHASPVMRGSRATRRLPPLRADACARGRGGRPCAAPFVFGQTAQVPLFCRVPSTYSRHSVLTAAAQTALAWAIWVERRAGALIGKNRSGSRPMHAARAHRRSGAVMAGPPSRSGWGIHAL